MPPGPGVPRSPSEDPVTTIIDQHGVHFALTNVAAVDVDGLDVVVTFTDGREPRRCGPMSCASHAAQTANALAIRAR